MEKETKKSDGTAISADLLERFRALDDETLRSAITQIAAAAGVSDRKAARASENVERIRSQLSGMSVQDLQVLASHIKPETTQEILRTLKSEGLL